VSLCRPLYYEWPEDNNAYLFEDEYMFGDDILVAPIVTEAGHDGMTARCTWLPEGRWFDVCRNKVVNGNRVLTDLYAMEEIPYFYRAGSVIVNNPPMMNLNTRPDRLILKVVPGADGETSLYEDEGDTEGYKQGAYTITRISHQGNQLIIHPREGRFPGMPDSRAYTAEFLAQQRPSAVMVNGKQIASDAWSYDQDKRVVTVNIPRTSCQHEISIKLKG
jgi:alpha-glucosidase (family GH31 glycosyl hydrolase)